MKLDETSNTLNNESQLAYRNPNAVVQVWTSLYYKYVSYYVVAIKIDHNQILRTRKSVQNEKKNWTKLKTVYWMFEYVR